MHNITQRPMIICNFLILIDQRNEWFMEKKSFVSSFYGVLALNHEVDIGFVFLSTLVLLWKQNENSVVWWLIVTSELFD